MTDRNSGKSVAIIGAGAMGCFFAARLASSGAELTLVDIDAARLAMLEELGIVLEADEGVVTAKVSARLAADLEGPFSLVVVFTKGMHTAAAVASVGHVAGGGTPVLTLQNGIGNAEVIAAHFPRENVLMGVTDYPADLKPIYRQSISPKWRAPSFMLACRQTRSKRACATCRSPSSPSMPRWPTVPAPCARLRPKKGCRSATDAVWRWRTVSGCQR